MTWTPIELSIVRKGDMLRLDRGEPFEVQKVVGVHPLELTVMDQRGLQLTIQDTDLLERYTRLTGAGRN